MGAGRFREFRLAQARRSIRAGKRVYEEPQSVGFAIHRLLAFLSSAHGARNRDQLCNL